MNRLSSIEAKQDFLQKLRTKIRNQEITEKDLVIILLEEKAKCYTCGREITKPELEKIKKFGTYQRYLLTQWEKKLSGLPNIQEVIRLFDRVRIKH